MLWRIEKVSCLQRVVNLLSVYLRLSTLSGIAKTINAYPPIKMGHKETMFNFLVQCVVGIYIEEVQLEIDLN